MIQELHNNWEEELKQTYMYPKLVEHLLIGHVKLFIKTVEKEAYERGKEDLRNALAPAVKTVEEICRQIRKEERESLKKKVEGMKVKVRQITVEDGFFYRGLRYIVDESYNKALDELLSLLSEE